ncbi:MAG: 16S rRNA (adenine(1518)-N(6)/adenine(1519)-N(6))-dimethyltransferase RsmA [Vulcanimicrobiota bacterium]
MGRKWGQHFLRSQATVDRILKVAQLSNAETVLEIGPGEGVLTLELCRLGRRVHAFEVDPELAEALRRRELENLVVHEGDFLRQDVAQLLGSDAATELTVVANLPYYITAPIMERLFWERIVPLKRAILMVQEEVAQRVCGPASRQAGALTYIAGAFFHADYLFKVPPGCFSPPPKVDSAVIELTPREDPASGEEAVRTTYERIVSSAFRARRKQLTRSLRVLHPRAAELLEEVGIDPKRRPETLTVQEFWSLARNWPRDE